MERKYGSESENKINTNAANINLTVSMGCAELRVRLKFAASCSVMH